jgi:hypothetical protein
VELHLRGIVVEVDKDDAPEGESAHVLEVSAKSSAAETGECPGKQHLGGAIDSLLKPWPEPNASSLDDQVDASAVVSNREPDPEFRPELIVEPEAEPELESEREAEPESEPQKDSETLERLHNPEPLPIETAATAPFKVMGRPEPEHPADSPDEARPAVGVHSAKRWLIPLCAGLIIVTLWLLAVFVEDTQSETSGIDSPGVDHLEELEVSSAALPDSLADGAPVVQQTDRIDSSGLPDISPTKDPVIETVVLSEKPQATTTSTDAVEEPSSDQGSVEDVTSGSTDEVTSQLSIEGSEAPVVVDNSSIDDVESEPQLATAAREQSLNEIETPDQAETEPLLREAGRVSESNDTEPQVVVQPPRIEEPRRILLSADRALEQGRLVQPPEANAFDLYSRVISLDPEIEEAAAGLVAVRQALINRALAQLATGDLKNADESLVAAAEAGANPMMVADLRNEVEYQIRIADAEAGQFESLYPFSELVVVAQRPPRVSNIQGLEGEVSVDVEFTVAVSGAVSDVEVLSDATEEVRLAVTNAVSDWRFEPVLFNRRPVPVRSSLSILLPN